MKYQMEPIATIHTDLPDKFGIPRQSGLVPSLTGTISFEAAYRMREAVRGLEGFSHIWLLWLFENPGGGWRATVRPPRLGGNTHMGVFATRSPFRPNPIGLSCVRLEKVTYTPDGPVLHVSGADLRDGTKILDIKPYLPFADAHPEAEAGFAKEPPGPVLSVDCKEELLSLVPAEKREALFGILSQDPRPPFRTEAERVFGICFAGLNVRFTVEGDRLMITQITKITETD